MYIKYKNHLSSSKVNSLLERFDMSFEEPLHNEIDFNVYSEKLSLHAHFILAYDEKELMGFIAYYINKDRRYAYIPFIAVHKEGRHRGIGHLMLSYLLQILPLEIKQISLEVKEDNNNAQAFYKREGFCVLSDFKKGKLLLNKIL